MVYFKRAEFWHRTGTVGPAGPCRPEKESREIAPARVALYGVGRHRIALAKRIQLGVTAKEARIVALNRADGLRPKCRHLNCLRSGIVRVGSELSLQSCPKRSLPFPVQFLISLIEFARRPLVQNPCGLTMEPVGRPVGCRVGAMAPDRTQLLPSYRSPDVLTG